MITFVEAFKIGFATLIPLEPVSHVLVPGESVVGLRQPFPEVALRDAAIRPRDSGVLLEQPALVLVGVGGANGVLYQLR